MRNYLPIAQKLQLPKGAPKLVITAENVIQATHTSPRGSTGGPDGIVLDLLARLLLGVDAAVYGTAVADELASNPAYAYLGALQTVIQQFADGGVPADLAVPLLSATGFAFAENRRRGQRIQRCSTVPIALAC